MVQRTKDRQYGVDYWQSYDNGAGYEDGVLWEDLAHVIKELWGYEGTNDVSGQQLLDIGCAKGFLVKHLRRRGFDAWGVDISRYAVAHADKQAEPYIRRWNMTSPNPPQFGWGYFNKVVCLETLEHVDNPVGALRNAFRLLKPGGTALLAICVDEHDDWETDPTHISVFPREYWVEQLQCLDVERDIEAEAFVRQFAFWKHHQGIFVARRVS